MLGSLILLTLQLATALYFERFLVSGWFELFVIFIGMLCAVCLWYGEYLRERWADVGSAVFYVLCGINLSFLVYWVGHWGAYSFGMLFAFVGLVRSIVFLNSDDDWLEDYYKPESLETYSTSEREQVVDPDPIYVNFARADLQKSTRKRASSTKKKTTRKKSTRKKK